MAERQLFLEHLEDRRLLATAPRLTGIQPNNSDIFSFVDQTSNVRDIAPRQLTLRFDENQQIDPTSLGAVRISRGGADGIPGNSPQDFIVPGFIGVGDAPRENEIVIRFADSLPDDVYQIEIIGVGSSSPLRNTSGQAYTPTLADGDGDDTKDTVRFELDLGPQVVAVVPQPISRNSQGTLIQSRNQIQVFFNDDDLFVQSSNLGQPLPNSAENPEFYQLIFTSDTVRNTDDVVILPTLVKYDSAANMATLTFAQDLDKLLHPDTQALVGPGTFRLRVGTDEAAPLPPLSVAPVQEVASDLNTGDQVVVQFTAVRPGEQDLSVFVSRRDQGGPGAPLVHVVGRAVSIDINSNPGNESTAADIVAAVNGHPGASNLLVASISHGNPATKVGDRPVTYSPLQLHALGSSFATATNLTDDTDIGPVLTVVGSGMGFVDGHFFEITDTFNVRRKFEFDSNVPPIKNDPTAISITFDSHRSQSDMSQAITNAINTASFGTQATLAGNQIHFTGDSFVDLSSGVQGIVKEFLNRYDLGQVLEVTVGGSAFVEGQTFDVVDGTGVTRTFEFDSGFILRVAPPLALQVPAAGTGVGGILDGHKFSVTDGTRTVTFEFDAGAGITAGNVAVPFTPGDSVERLGALIADAIRNSVLSGGLVGLTPVHLGGGVVEIRSSTAGANANVLTSTLTKLTFNVGNLDGQTFTITEGLSTVTFEYDSDSVFNAANKIITFLPTDTYLDVARETAAAISAQVALGALTTVQPLELGNGAIHLGGNATTTLNTSTAGNLTQSGTPGAAGGRVPITFVPHASFTVNDVASAIASAINAATATMTGFQATALAAGNRIRLSNDRYVRLPQGLNGITVTAQGHFDAGPVLVVTKTGSGFVDGQAIHIVDDQGITRSVEFDSDGSLLDPTAVAIQINGTTSIATIAERIADAINASNFRVQATVVGDRIYLTNDREVTLDTGLNGVTKTSQGIIISSSIDPMPYNLDFSGGTDEPGHRDLPPEVGDGVAQHINSAFADNGTDNTPGVTTVLYNFRQDIGAGFSNVITEQQANRAREAFQLWGKYLGVQFLESASQGLTVATADLNVLNPQGPDVLDFAANNFRVRIDPDYGDGLLVMDSTISWNTEFGDPVGNNDWFLNAMVGIGSMLGLDLASDLPLTNLMARFTSTFRFLNVPDPEPVFPGNADIIHGQHLYRPDGVDIDLYKFNIDLDVDREGIFSAETFAERLPNASLLNTALRLYKENPDGTRVLIAQNDDYFSRDSFIELKLGAGVYYIGVSASGNNNYDPTIDNTGVGGTSQGNYNLRLNFRSRVEEQNTISDADGAPTALDGDANGTPGGVHNFWFQTRPLDRVIEVTGNGTTVRDGQVMTITNSQGVVKQFEFDSNSSIAGGNVRVTFATTMTPEQIAQSLAAAIAGAVFNVTATVSGRRITLTGDRSVTLSATFVGVNIEGKTIFVDKTADPNADGSLGKPFNNIARSGIPNAFSSARPGDIIRIVGNGGADGNVDTLGDNLAYEIGFGTLPGQTLTDGSDMSVPKGVTVMIEPGAVFKMRSSRIGVGSSSLTVDRSGGALQVLGTPQHQVYFTSWLDETIGRDTHAPTTIPSRGDWGGLVFRTDLDDSQNRPNLENEGIFLNYVNHADIRYGGGGNVVIDSIQQVVQPIQMVTSRPTISYNTITESADSAMSASPNNFDETNFHSPRYQADGLFTSDYERIGPEIHSNRLLRNSTNGLFIRIETPAGNTLEPLTVSGRFDDTDIVHVLSENLVIQGSQREPFLDVQRPAVDLVTFTPRTGGSLVSGTYNYKMTFVDANGFESRPSNPTANFTLTGINTAIQLNQLPPVSTGYVSRRVYRTDDPTTREYRLVAEVNASDTVFVDNGTTLSTILDPDPPPSDTITLTAQARGSLVAGDYNYRIVFVDALGHEGAASDPTATITVAGAQTEGGILLDNLPAANGKFVSRRIYRSTTGGITPYVMAAEIDATSTQFIDDGFTAGGNLDVSSFGVVRANLHARLAVDPGMVVKLEGARIEARFGGQFIAEGLVGQEVIFTSRLDDSFGAGGTFDTNNDDTQSSGEQVPSPGNWGGLFFGQLSRASIDNALISFGGGINKIEGTFTGFNVIEAHQAELRLTNSILENNAEGVGGQGPLDRFGRGYNLPATIFVRGSQPVIVDNIIRDNNTRYAANKSAANLQMPVITINANSFIPDNIVDEGRSTGPINQIQLYTDNRGPLVRNNRLSNNAINGMVIRGEELTTESIWDDTDIVHVLTNQFDQQDTRNSLRKWAFDEIVIPEHHVFGGLRLQSSSTESLVVKLLGQGRLNNATNLIDDGEISNRNAYDGAGFTVTGLRLATDDRIGGTLHVVGQPGFPVILTSLNDDSVGAGIQPDDRAQTDTNNNGIATIPRPNDWRSVRLDQFSNDRNVDIVLEMQPPDASPAGLNETTNTAQVLGELAPNEQSGDENLRMGFDIHGLINEPNDVDVYSFTGAAGTEVWLDIDRTAHGLDTVVELLDANGEVLASSDDTVTQTATGLDPLVSPTHPEVVAGPLRKFSTATHASGLPKDFYTVNPRDAGMRIVLPGQVGTRAAYHIQVRSKNGLTTGLYQMQVRTRETDEFPGSTVRFADIRYANNGVEIYGLPAHSPLLGEAAEDEEASEDATFLGSAFVNNGLFGQDFLFPGFRPQNVGNLLEQDRNAISIAGTVSGVADIDIYTFDVRFTALQSQNTTSHFASTSFDVDYADALVRFNSTLSVFDSSGALVYVGRDSNIAEDRPGPLEGNDLDDLSRGSIGEKDPFIGPVELAEGQYFAAMTSNSLMPNDLDQFTSPNPSNPLVRLEPVNSIVRIAEDHVESTGGSTADDPVVPVLFPRPGGTGPNWHVTQRRALDSGHGLTNKDGVTANGGTSNSQTPDELQGTLSFNPANGSAQFTPDTPAYVGQQLIVGFTPDIDATERAAIVQNKGAALLKAFSSGNTILVQIPASTSVTQAIASWNMVNGVAFAEPNYVITTAATFPNDPSFFQQYGLHNIGQTGGRPDADIDAPEAWDTTRGSSNVVVAVIDTGVDYLHNDLAANMWRNPGEIANDNIDNDLNGYVDDIFGIDTINGDRDPRDDVDHGTHVAGTIAAVGNNSNGVTGVAWQTQLMALKFLGPSGGTTAGAIEAIDYMTMMKTDHGINIMVSNNSWGGGGFSQALVDSIDASIQAGILFVASAGNNATNNDVVPSYPAAYNLSGILSVAATDHDDQIANFSNYGRVTVDVAAPGVDILSTFPGNRYGLLSGTSMAAPHVSGVAALIASQQLTAVPATLKSAILAGADRLPQLSGLVLTSARLNAARSLSANTGGSSFYFGDETIGNVVPGNASGSLTSNVFPLKGYSRLDMPTLYFNYFLDSNAADTFQVVVTNSQGVDTIVASSRSGGIATIEPLFQGSFTNTWRQARIDLSPFAGQDGLKVRFDYQDTTPGNTNEGAYVDDIIIGFTERGEKVTSATAGSFFVANPKLVPTDIAQGNYQLEIRNATDFATYDPLLDQVNYDRSFDTNDRFAIQTTLIAPAGSEVVDGQTFTISDGINEVTFEYEDPQFGTGILAGNIEIRFKSFVSGNWVLDSNDLIARRIRDAINSPLVQTILNITAATSDGVVSGTTSTSNRINLFGSAVVDRPAPFSITETTTDGNRLRDTILGNGIQLPATGRNATFVGSELSAGFFSGGKDLLGLDAGIVLSTGDVGFGNGPNSSDTASGHASGAGDADLDNEFTVITEDSTSLVFDFEFSNGVGGDLFLNFVFASEEYTELDPNFLDAFALLLDEDADGGYVNIALVPSTPDPVGLENVNSTTNPALFKNNDPSDNGAYLDEFGYDGFSTRIVATATALGPGPHRLKIVLGDVGDAAGDTAVFIESMSVAESPFQQDPSGIASVLHEEKGDQNRERPQGVVLVHSNTFTASKNFGVVADAGDRDTDGQVANLSSGLLVVVNAPISLIGDGFRACPPNSGLLCTPDVVDFIDFFPGEFSTDFAVNLTPVNLQNPHPGPARNLVVENLPDHGGFAPGVVISNNTIHNEGIGGIHVSGDSRTFEVMPQRPPLFDTAGNPVYPFQTIAGFTAGDMVNDGNLLMITAFGQTVTFEFEDVAGSGNTTNRWANTGSSTVCGDGWDDGHIPIYFRRTSSSPCASFHPLIPTGRTLGYTQTEMAIAIKDAIDSSPLVSNDTTLTVKAQMTLGRFPGGDDVFQIHPIPGPGPGGEDPVVYLEGVTSVEEFNRGSCTFSVPDPGCVVFVNRQLSIAHGPQSFSRVVNNTIFGHNGNYSFFPDPVDEPNDTIYSAIDTRQGRQHNPESFNADATIGDTVNFRDDTSVDVDTYKFQLDIGDHVVIDINALSRGTNLTSVLRLFNASGDELIVSRGITTSNTDPLIDFTATTAGTYYVSVSGEGNETYSPLSLSDRTTNADTGDYTIDINVRAPRQYTLVVQDGTNYTDGEQFLLEDVTGRVATFEFDTGGGVTVGNIPIAITAAMRHPEVSRQIELAINNNNNANNPNPAALNNKQNLPNGAFGVANPLNPVNAEAFGGYQQERFGLEISPINPRAEGERFVIIRNIARFEDIDSEIIFNPDPMNPLDPNGPDLLEHHVPVVTPNNNGRNDNPSDPQADNTGPNDLDHIIQERGILVSEQATPTLLNNILSNLRVGVEQVEFQDGSEGPVDAQRSVPGGMVEGGSLYQDTLFNSNLVFGTGDFNFEVASGAPLFVNASAGNFYPAPFALSIDSSVDTVPERDEFEPIRDSIGLAHSPILSPDRDATGQLRVDDPSVTTPSGQGANVFKDRGSLDRSDFVGPAAALVDPLDNDNDGLDLDPAVSTVQLEEGIFTSFTVQIVDGFESSDPYPGVGVDDNTLTGRIVNIEEDGSQLSVSGPAVTLFQDGVFLREGIDYTYRFDRTSNAIRLTPLSGVWPNDKVYVIRVNNRDRFVIDAGAGVSVTDGDSFRITNDVGDTLTMEFDSGYSLVVPATLGVQIPFAATGIGGISDGQRFIVDDGLNTITFEFDRNNNVLPGSLAVTYANGDSLDALADSLVTALIQASNANLIKPLVPRNLGGGLVHLGATPDHRFDFANTTLLPTVTQRPFSLVVPTGGGAVIQDNEVFTISQGPLTVTFEFDQDASGSTVPGSVIIPYLVSDTPDILANLIAQALVSLPAIPLNLSPIAVGGGVVELNAQPTHLVNVTQSALTRTMVVGGVGDGERFTIGNLTGTVTFEFDNDGVFLDVDNNNIPDNVLLPFSAASTHVDLANLIVTAVTNANVGLQPVHVGNGIVNLGGTLDHTLNTVRAPSLIKSGAPGVQSSTTLQLPVSKALQVPANGGPDFTDGETFSIDDGTKVVVFEFDKNGVFEDANGDNQPDNTVITYFGAETQGTMAALISAALGSANLGLSPTVLGNGIIQLGAGANHEIDLQGSSLTRSDRIGALNDAESFTVDDGTNVVTFEFESLLINNGVVAGNTAILFLPGSSVDLVADATVAALRGSNLGLGQAANRGNGRVELGDSVRHLTDTTLAPSIVKTGAPGGAEAINYRLDFSESQTARAIVLAINNAGTIQPNQTQARIDGLSSQIRGGSTLFVDMYNSQGGVADFVNGFAALSGIDNFFLPAVKDLPGNTLKPNQATNETQFIILLPGVQLDFGDIPDSLHGLGRYPTLFENNGARHVITSNPLILGDSVDADPDGQPTLAADGDDADHVLDILTARLTVTGVPPYTLQVPLTGAAGITDNETFTIQRGTNPPVRFEFDKNSSGISAGSDQRIALNGNETQDEVADAIVDAIETRLGELVLRPANLGGGLVFVGGTQTSQGPSHTIDLSQSSLEPSTRLPIAVTTPAAGLSLTIPALLQLQVPGAGGSAFADGFKFTISDTVHAPVTFEFDNNGSVTAGNRRIPFSTLQTQALIADSVTAAIVQAVAEGALAGLNPVNQGAGRIDLGAQAAHKLDATGSGMSQIGPLSDAQTFVITDGVHSPVTFEFDTNNSITAGNRQIAISLTNSANEFANAIVTAIKNAIVANELVAMNPINIGNAVIDIDSPTGVTINAAGASTLIAAGVANGIADGQAFSIRDGESIFRFEFDRAETQSVTVGSIPVLITRNATADDVAAAIRDAVNSAGLALDAVTEPGGIIQLTGNDEDGVEFEGIFTPIVPSDPDRDNLQTTIHVTASGDGFLDAWMDWNQDGDFEDPGEQVFASEPVSAGVNTLFVTVPPMFSSPSTLPLGDTYARFRISSDGALQPTGLAVDGEVEDYRIRVISNDRPEIVGVGILDENVLEDAADTLIDASLYFTDTDIANGNGDQLTFTVVSVDNPTLVTAAFATDGKTLVLDYQPNQNGLANITVMVTDHGGLFVQQSFVVTVGKVNDQPVANPQVVTINEDTPIQITLTADDGDPMANEVQSLVYSRVQDPTRGVITNFNPGTGQFTYTPNDDFNGTDTFVFRVTDDDRAGLPFSLQSAPATVTINVTAVNDLPNADPKSVNMSEDGTLVITLTGDDGDSLPGEVQTLTFAIASVPPNGTLTGFNPATGQVTYQPNANFNSSDRFTFTVTDNGSPPQTSVASTVTVNIAPVNDPPVANNQSVSITEDTPATVTFGVNDGDPEVAQVLTLEILSAPTHGSLGAINQTNGSVLYTPNPGYTGSDSFTYRVLSDDALAGPPANLSSGAGTVTITVDPVNDAPIANAATINTSEDTAISFTLTGDDGDPEFIQALTFAAVTQPTRGTLQLLNAGAGQFRYTPGANFNGTDSFTFRVTDDGNPNLSSTAATVTINVSQVNDSPVANGQSVTTTEDTAIVITLTGDDGDPLTGENQALIFEVASAPTRGTLSPINQTTRQVTYTPGADFNGLDSFTFRIRDDATAGPPSGLASVPAAVNVTVNAVNDAPQFNSGPNVAVDEDSGGQTIIGWATAIRPGPLTATDENGQTVTFTVNNNNAGLFLSTGQPTVTSSGTLSFTPGPNANGVAVVTLSAQDNGSNVSPNVNTSATQTFTITVNAVNDAPQFTLTQPPNVTMNEDVGPQTVLNWARNIAAGPSSASDEASQVLTFNVSFVTTGNLSFSAGPAINPVTGALTYTPAPNTNGTATVTVTLSDNGASAPPNINTSAAQSFTITVNAINDAPQFNLPQPNVTVSEDAGAVRVGAWATGILPGPPDATDEVSQTLTFVTTVLSLQGGLSFLTPPAVNATTGDLTFQTAADKHGSATVTVRLQDNGSGFSPHINSSAAQTFTISVNSVNDPPQFTVGADQRVNEDSGQQTVVGWATNIRPGPVTASDESSQTVTFTTTNNNAALFSVQPSVASNGTLTYAPAPNAFGAATVIITASDNGSPIGQTTQQFVINVDPVNDAPEVTIPNLQIAQEDSPLAIGGATAITVADIDANQIELKLQTANGVVNVAANVAGGLTAANILNNGTSTVTLSGTLAAINTTLANANGVTYQGNLNFNGFDTITVTANDLGNTGSPGPLSDAETIRISVSAVNDPPELANPIVDMTLDEDAANTLIELFPRVFNDVDIATNNDQLSLRVVSNSNLGLVSATINGTVLTLDLLPDANGQAVIVLEAADRSLATVRDTMTLTVLAVNDRPTAVNDNLPVNMNTPTNLNVLANDTDVDGTIDPSTVQITAGANNATLSVNNDGTIRFTPANGFSGTSKFRYVVLDNSGAQSNEAEVTVTVNSTPTAANDSATTSQGTPVVIDVTANDTDSDGTLNRGSVVVTRQPSSGTTSVNGTTGAITYTPTSTFSGTVTIGYTVRDNLGALSNEATVTVTVTPTRFWQNAVNNNDVNADGFVSAIDVLQIINRLNSSGPGPLPTPSTGFSPPPFYDVNGDGQITPQDALIVINFLNSGGGAEGGGAEGSSGGEGEGSSAILTDAGEGESSAQPFGILLSPAFSEFRYIPLADRHGHLLSSAFTDDQVRDDELLRGTVSRAATPLDCYAIDRTVAEFGGVDSESANALALGTAHELGDALSSLVSGMDALTQPECTVDAALDELLADDFSS